LPIKSSRGLGKLHLCFSSFQSAALQYQFFSVLIGKILTLAIAANTIITSFVMNALRNQQCLSIF